MVGGIGDVELGLTYRIDGCFRKDGRSTDLSIWPTVGPSVRRRTRC